jgi:N-acetylglucosamine malate deacetylase 1
MEAHATQVKARAYVEMQLTRARVNGLRAGVGHAIALYPNDPPVVNSLARLGRNANRF